MTDGPPKLSPAEARLEPEAALARLRRLGVACVILFSVLGLAGGVRFATAVAVGGAVALAHYGLLIWTIKRLVTPGQEDATAAKAALGFGLRYVLLGLILYVILSVWRANALAVIIGFSAPVMAVILEGAVQVYWTWASSGKRATRASRNRS